MILCSLPMVSTTMITQVICVHFSSKLKAPCALYSAGETSYENPDDLDEVTLSPATTSALELNINTRMLDFEDDDRLASGVSFIIKSFGSEIQKNMMVRFKNYQ